MNKETLSVKTEKKRIKVNYYKLHKNTEKSLCIKNWKILLFFSCDLEIGKENNLENKQNKSNTKEHPSCHWLIFK